jgi:ABC-type glutathione transport system ATPase component
MPPSPLPLLEVQDLCKTYAQGRWWKRQFCVRALIDVDLVLKTGSTLALVGESGSGKTTLAMCLVGLERPDAGDIRFEGKSLLQFDRKERISAGRDIQLIFQDSAGALNPRMSAAEIIEEPLLIHGQWGSKQRAEWILETMEQVGFRPIWKDRRPSELSGGQRQRLAIARALVLKPKLLVLDEALAGLDLSIQGQITNLLLDLQTAQGLSYLYISHNLELVARIADDVAVIHEGRVVEQAKPSEIGKHTQSPRLQALGSPGFAGKLTFGAHTGA